MASSPFTCHHNNRAPPPIRRFAAAATNSYRTTSGFSPYPYSFQLKRRDSIPPKRNSWSWCCRATDPQPEPPPEKHISPISGVRASLSKYQDTLQIFFAVLFWMSLFFWSSIWDGGGNGGGTPKSNNKSSGFRK